MSVIATSQVERPAIFLVSRLGDQLISLPSIRALCSLFPCGIQLLLGEGMFSFLYQDLPVNGVTRVWWETERANIDVPRTVRSAAHCDLFVCVSTPDAARTAELAEQMGARWTVGRSAPFNHQASGEPFLNVFDRLFAIPQSLEPSLQLDSFSAPPPLSLAAQTAAARRISSFRGKGERLLFVHPETEPQRTWPSKLLGSALKTFLAGRPDYKVILFSLAEIDLGVYPERIMRCDAHLELALALMRSVDLFLGVDSCYLHAADLFRIPGIGLFGASDPARWGFRFSERRHICAESMEDIPPDTVSSALLELAA